MLKNTPNLKYGCTHFMRDTWNEGKQISEVDVNYFNIMCM